MKGALGSAFILNMVITFILIFFVLLIGSMAYSKAYKVKNYILNSVVFYDEQFGRLTSSDANKESSVWNSMVNGYLSKVGYMLSTNANTCPVKNGSHPDMPSYKILRDTRVGSYDYCIYVSDYNNGRDVLAVKRYTYKVITYIKFDLPIVGEYVKLPLTGESKIITKYE